MQKAWSPRTEHQKDISLKPFPVPSLFSSTPFFLLSLGYYKFYVSHHPIVSLFLVQKPVKGLSNILCISQAKTTTSCELLKLLSHRLVRLVGWFVGRNSILRLKRNKVISSESIGPEIDGLHLKRPKKKLVDVHA